MSRADRIWLIFAASLTLIGCVLFGGVMMALQWDFTKLSSGGYETREYTLEEACQDISIVTGAADVILVPSETASVVCYEQNRGSHTVAVQDGTLIISLEDTRKWYDHIGISYETPQITVAVPAGEYGVLTVRTGTGKVEIPKAFSFEHLDISGRTGDVTTGASASGSIKIETSTGYISLQDVSADALELSVSTGDITASGVTCAGDIKVHVSTGKTKLSDVTCRNITSDGNTGDMFLKNVIASEQVAIKRNTGDITLEGCDAAELVLETDTGDVSGTLRSEKIFVTKTDTGRVDVPKTVTGGKCEITTNTGKIELRIQ